MRSTAGLSALSILPPRAPGESRRGFSLAELVTALAIAGVMLALTGPRFSAMRDRAATRSASADLGALFSTARHLAITRRATVAVILDASRSAVQVRSDDRTLVRHEFGTTYGVTLAANRDSSIFDARGFGYGAANLTVILRRGGAADTIAISRLGRVRSAW